jgi:peroxiredoxin Q/BCP
VLGISFDSPAENKSFRDKFNFAFPLLSDPDRKVGMAYDAADTSSSKHAKRFTYVIGADGKIEQAIDTKAPGAQAAELLASL